MVMRPSSGHPVILYDGVCGLCNRLVQFVLRHDSQARFRFASLQSDFSSQVLKRYSASPDHRETMYLVLDFAQPTERLLARSQAARRLSSGLDRPWNALGLLVAVLPRTVADWGYNLIARHRYRIFGKYESCLLPAEPYRKRFLDLAQPDSPTHSVSGERTHPR
jgi:predicted DCC family thiol-disulfide oxidoreductase YuxK